MKVRDELRNGAMRGETLFEIMLVGVGFLLGVAATFDLVVCHGPGRYLENHARPARSPDGFAIKSRHGDNHTGVGSARAKANPNNPQAFGICDRCGFQYQHRDLSGFLSALTVSIGPPVPFAVGWLGGSFGPRQQRG